MISQISGDVVWTLVYLIRLNRFLFQLMIIQTAQSLHPGGKYYPQDNKPQQTSAPENWDGSAQVTPDGTSEFEKGWSPTLHAGASSLFMRP